MTDKTAEQIIAEAFVQGWDQHIGQDGAIAVLNALNHAGLTVTPTITAEESELRRNSDRAYVEAMVTAAYEDAAKIVDERIAYWRHAEETATTGTGMIKAFIHELKQNAAAIRARATGAKSP